jgi:hypothetical protein
MEFGLVPIGIFTKLQEQNWRDRSSAIEELHASILALGDVDRKRIDIQVCACAGLCAVRPAATRSCAIAHDCVEWFLSIAGSDSLFIVSACGPKFYRRADRAPDNRGSPTIHSRHCKPAIPFTCCGPRIVQLLVDKAVSVRCAPSLVSCVDTLVPTLTEKLGDGKVFVRQANSRLLRKLMQVTWGPCTGPPRCREPISEHELLLGWACCRSWRTPACASALHTARCELGAGAEADCASTDR